MALPSCFEASKCQRYAVDQGDESSASTSLSFDSEHFSLALVRLAILLRVLVQAMLHGVELLYLSVPM